MSVSYQYVFFNGFFNYRAQSKTALSTIGRYKEHTNIQLSKNRNNRPLLSVTHPDPEDGYEGLKYEWKVQFPNGRIKRYSKPRIKLPARTGQYKTSVTVGDSVTIDYDFYWSR